MVILLFFCGSSIAKLLDVTQIKIDGALAQPIFNIEDNEIVNLTATNNEGIYNFLVKNYDDSGKITEINMKYNIEILNKQDESISVKIFKDNNQIEMKDNKSDYFILTNQEKQEHQYKIEIKYDETKLVPSEDIIEDIKIKVYSEQEKM